jgi:hypothetical protein
MEQFISVNGKMDLDTAEENNCGMMVQSMKDIGEQIQQTEKVDLFTLMEMSIKENGRMIRRK